MNEVLAFDWGTTIVGILNVKFNMYIPYRWPEEAMKEGAKRIVFSAGTIVSFGGKERDLMELLKILDLPSEFEIRGKHDDMSEIISIIRWPPHVGTTRIHGPDLPTTYRHYFGAELATPPSYLQDEYEVTNWTVVI